MSDDHRPKLSNVVPLRYRAPPVYYHLRVSWQTWPRCWTTLWMIHQDAQEGMRLLLENARLLGYTEPRWWEFWRWGEPRYAKEMSDE